MDEDFNLAVLLCLINKKQEIKAKDIDEYRPSNCRPSDPFNLLTEDFVRSLKAVLNVRRIVVRYRWQTFFDTFYKEMLSSPKTYVTFIMFACIKEDIYINHIFEKFLSVCALVKLLCDETFVKEGVNFSDLNFDIMNVFYLLELEKNFCKCGGIRRFVEYVHGHRYIRWIQNKNYSLLLDDPTAFFNATHIYLHKNLKKELKKESVFTIDIDPTEIVNNSSCQRAAQIVLDSALTKVPHLPNSPKPVVSMEADKRKHISKDTEEKRAAATVESEVKNVTSREYSSSKSESKISCDANNQDNIEWCENIIEEVIRHNRSKCSNNESSNNKIQEEVEGILKRLKEKTESLVAVLTEYDEKC